MSETGHSTTIMEAELWKISDNILVLMGDKKRNDGLVMNQSEAPAGDVGSYCCGEPNAADQWVKSISDGTSSGTVYTTDHGSGVANTTDHFSSDVFQ